MAKSEGVVCCDHQRRTCVQAFRSSEIVKFVELDIVKGLYLQESNPKEFDRRYQPMTNYPIDKACSLYVAYSQTIGATEEALDALGKFCSITNQEYEMATSKASSNEEKKLARSKSVAKPKAADKPAVSKPVAKTATKPEPKPSAKPATKAKAPAKSTGEKKASASGMFQDLIMEGKLTDDQIFDKVKSEFGLDDSKKSYVKWYRNHLAKQGKNPPAAK